MVVCVYVLVNGDEFVGLSWSNRKRCVQIQNDGDTAINETKPEKISTPKPSLSTKRHK
jgi:hypothetical protein